MGLLIGEDMDDMVRAMAGLDARSDGRWTRYILLIDVVLVMHVFNLRKSWMLVPMPARMANPSGMVEPDHERRGWINNIFFLDFRSNMHDAQLANGPSMFKLG